MATLFLFGFTYVLGTILLGNALDIQGPDHILANDQFKVSCRGSQAVRMKVHNCPVKYGLPRKNNGEFYLNASITHVKKPCKIQCFSGTLIETKEILVIEGIITSEKLNLEVWKGMPYTVSCSSRCRPGFCQVLWTTNRGSTFVKNDKDYTITSTPPYIDMQSHQLIVHTANSSTDYQCKLVSVTGRIIDSAEQYVDVKEPAADGATAKIFIETVKSYFKWSN